MHKGGNMQKKILTFILSVCLAVVSVALLTACKDKNKTSTQDAEIRAVYALAVENGETMSYSEWLESIKGADGKGIKSVRKVLSEGLVDTYIITFTDNSTTSFQITNGAKGDNGDKGDKGDTGATIKSIKSSYSNDGQYVYYTYYMSDGSIRYSELEVAKTYTMSLNIALKDSGDYDENDTKYATVLMSNTPDNDIESYPWLRAYLTDQFGSTTEIDKENISIIAVQQSGELYRIQVNYCKYDAIRGYNIPVLPEEFEVYNKDFETDFYSINTFEYSGVYQLGNLPEGSDVFENNHFYAQNRVTIYETEDDFNSHVWHTYTRFLEVTKDNITGSGIIYGTQGNHVYYYGYDDSNRFNIYVTFYNEAKWHESDLQLLLSYNRGYLIQRTDIFPEISAYWMLTDGDDYSSGTMKSYTKKVLPSMVVNQDEFNFTKTGRYLVKFNIDGRELEDYVVIYDPMENNISEAYLGIEDDFHSYDDKTMFMPACNDLTEASAAISALVGEKIYVGTYKYNSIVYTITASDIAKIDFSEVDLSKVGLYVAYLDLKFDKSNEKQPWVGECRAMIPIAVQPRNLVTSIDEFDFDSIKTYLGDNNIEYQEYTCSNEYMSEYAIYSDKVIVFGNYIFIDFFDQVYEYTRVGNEIKINVCVIDDLTSTSKLVELELKVDEELNTFDTIVRTGDVVATYYVDFYGINYKFLELDNGYCDVYVEDEGEYHLALTAKLFNNNGVLECGGWRVKVVEQISENEYRAE